MKLYLDKNKKIKIKSANELVLLKLSDEMDILIKNNIETGKIIYKFNYNISPSNDMVAGGVVLTDKFIFTYDEETKLKYYDLDKIENLKCVLQIGCVSIDFKYNGEYTELCRANMEYKNIFPDFTAQFDLFLLDRTKDVSDKSEKNICPKCGGFYESGTEFCAECANKSATFIRIIKLAAAHKTLLIIAVVMAIAASALSMIVPAIQKNLVDNYISPPETFINYNEVETESTQFLNFEVITQKGFEPVDNNNETVTLPLGGIIITEDNIKITVFNNAILNTGDNKYIINDLGGNQKTLIIESPDENKIIITSYGIKTENPNGDKINAEDKNNIKINGVNLKDFINSRICDADIDNWHNSFQLRVTFLDILWVILWIVLLRALIEFMIIARTLLITKVGTNLSYDLRSIVFKKIQDLSISKILKRTAGELINRVQHDTETINDFLTYIVPDIMQQLIITIVISAVMIKYNWLLALMIFIPLPLFLFINAAAWQVIGKLFGKAWRCRSAASSVLYDIFSGIKVVKSYGTEKQEVDRCAKALKAQLDIEMKSEVFFSVLYPITRFCLHLGSYFLTLYIGNKIIGGEMTKGEMMQFMIYLSMIYGPLEWMGNIGRWVSHALTSAAKLFEVIDQKLEIKIQEKPVKKDIDGFIDLKNVYFGYKDYEMVLRNVNLSVQPGEMIGIVGKSGVGKSTLINLLMRLYDVHEGSINIDGINIKDYDPNNLRSQIGAVLQETFLFSGTIYDNIAYAKADATRDEIIRASKFANAHDFIMKLPDGYNTKVGEHGHTLSGGERQRIAIARAVLHDPRILILDEATSALDTETEALVQDALQKLIKNRTTFAIAHRLSTLRNATRLIILDQGTIAEAGTHDELMAKKGIYYQLVMAQRQMSRMAIAKN